jgi:hypothetical protein
MAALVFESTERGDLHTILAENDAVFSVSEKLIIAMDVSEAMCFLHSMSMYGCGLSCRRVIVDRTCRAKVFLASAFKARDSSPSLATLDIEAFGEFLIELFTCKQLPQFSPKGGRSGKGLSPGKLDWLERNCQEYPKQLMTLVKDCIAASDRNQLTFANICHSLQTWLDEHEAQRQAREKAIPDGFICPITQDVMKDPVILIFDGHSYERKAIEDWLKRSNRSPLTNEALPEGYGGIVLVENYALKSAISSYQSSK